MTLWWVLGLIIVAFIIGYLIMAPRKKVASDEHIEPRDMRTETPSEQPKKTKILGASLDPDRRENRGFGLP